MLASRDRLLPRDDPAASRVIGQVFEKEGLDLPYEARANRVWQEQDGIHVIAGEQEVFGDALLLVTGRRPNVEGLDLQKAGVAHTGKGIQVDDTLRTSQSDIYAAGDCIGGFQFTHYAGFQARAQLSATRCSAIPARASASGWSGLLSRTPKSLRRASPSLRPRRDTATSPLQRSNCPWSKLIGQEPMVMSAVWSR